MGTRGYFLIRHLRLSYSIIYMYCASSTFGGREGSLEIQILITSGYLRHFTGAGISILLVEVAKVYIRGPQTETARPPSSGLC